MRSVLSPPHSPCWSPQAEIPYVFILGRKLITSFSSPDFFYEGRDVFPPFPFERLCPELPPHCFAFFVVNKVFCFSL